MGSQNQAVSRKERQKKSEAEIKKALMEYANTGEIDSLIMIGGFSKPKKYTDTPTAKVSDPAQRAYIIENAKKRRD